MQRVEVTGNSTANDRKEATAAKFVLDHKDITRFGDSSIAEVLRRVPGVTISGAGSQPREISLRGLGGGYTQILVNGEPVPSGFSMDTLSPDLIERIEVLRSASADMSAQSIAGSINIILKRGEPARQRDFKIGLSTYEGLWSGSSTGQYSDRVGSMSYSAAGSVNYERNRWHSTVNLNAWDGSGLPSVRRRTSATENREQLTIGFTPRLKWKPNDAHAITVDGLLQASRSRYQAQ